MFKLAERRTADRCIYCGEEGLYFGGVPLIAHDGNGCYRVRRAAEIEALLAAAYATPPEPARLVAGLHRVAAHLGDGNLSLAMIAAVHLRLADVPEDRIEHLAQAHRLLRANFNPAEPRDERGRWTGDGDPGNLVPMSSDSGSSAKDRASPRAGEKLSRRIPRRS